MLAFWNQAGKGRDGTPPGFETRAFALTLQSGEEGVALWVPPSRFPPAPLFAELPGEGAAHLSFWKAKHDWLAEGGGEANQRRLLRFKKRRQVLDWGGIDFERAVWASRSIAGEHLATSSI